MVGCAAHKMPVADRNVRHARNNRKTDCFARNGLAMTKFGGAVQSLAKLGDGEDGPRIKSGATEGARG